MARTEQPVAQSHALNPTAAEVARAVRFNVSIDRIMESLLDDVDHLTELKADPSLSFDERRHLDNASAKIQAAAAILKIAFGGAQ